MGASWSWGLSVSLILPQRHIHTAQQRPATSTGATANYNSDHTPTAFVLAKWTSVLILAFSYTTPTKETLHPSSENGLAILDMVKLTCPFNVLMICTYFCSNFLYFNFE
ncbi:hypothetical protein PoB_002210400 [Plakobranchus ocellatus]|uniref:Uncharacterized protein n=1 Tax=Plakobranchus ocellatus TaxID=259542 RepID=A0AAV3ZMI8_9GAST|nr:hypothetical protein PoB_002210400 [Plakobranchus ocellatus]